MIPRTAAVIIAVASTGLPNRPKGYMPALLEIAAVYVGPDAQGKLHIGNPRSGRFRSYVYQPRDIADSEVARRAQPFHEIPIHATLAAATGDNAAANFAQWLDTLILATSKSDITLMNWHGANPKFIRQLLSAEACGSATDASFETVLSDRLQVGADLLKDTVTRLEPHGVFFTTKAGRPKKSGSLGEVFNALARRPEGREMRWKYPRERTGAPGSALPQALRAAQVYKVARELPKAAPVPGMSAAAQQFDEGGLLEDAWDGGH